MDLLECPDCGAPVSTWAAACPQCGRPTTGTPPAPEQVEPTEPGATKPSDDSPEDAPYPFFPVSTGKFVALSICSFGIYELYWCYRNWQRIRDRSGESLSPFWRAFFAPLWCFSLFKSIQEYAGNRGIAVSWSSGGLGALYLVLSVSWRLPDPWWLVSIGTFLAMLPVLGTTQEVNASLSSTENTNTRLTGMNVVVLALGGLWVLLVMIGTFFPA